MADLDLGYVDQVVERLGRKPEAVIGILQALQRRYRYLPRAALDRVCEQTEIKPADITGVATFYNQFRLKPVGEHIIAVCHGTACHVKGSGLVQSAFERELKLAPGEDTDSFGRFTIEKVACLGCCTLAPVVQIDGRTFGRVAPSHVGDVLADFLSHCGNGKSPAPAGGGVAAAAHEGEVRVGLGSCCVAQGSGKVHEAIEQALRQGAVAAGVKRVGCVGMCHQTPLVELVMPDGGNKLFTKVSPEDAGEIVLDHFRPRGWWRRTSRAVARWLDRWANGAGPPDSRCAGVDRRDPVICAFLGPQLHLATEHGGRIDPLDLDEYLRNDGFAALRKCIDQWSPPRIVDEVKQSGLRGRGGAGFPTGLKWDRVRQAAAEPKYVVCNGDEGDPGAFMDRMLLESFPYRIIEGMAIAALAVGAHEAILYIRAEYPLAVERINAALARCAERGLLGEGLLGSRYSLRFRVQEGAGAFVCGEETALLASIEGRRGMPRLRPPFPAECGLWGKPTLVNNVETYALVPWIVRNGAAAFASIGAGASKGTKVFALAGKVRRGGLIEVPMGISLRQIVEEIGGGVPGGRSLKAVQVGGPSGGCVPAALADTPVDFESLTRVGAIMGSGGLVVLDDADCMVDIARYFLHFTQDQSCGKCTFCRVGTRRMLDILNRICEGRGRSDDLDQLELLAVEVQRGSICGLGRTAPNPVLSTLRYFRDEYEAHLAGRCPAGRCKALIHYRITDQCIGCTLCAQQCPTQAIPMTPYARHAVIDDRCTRCDTCRQVCPEHAVVVE